MDSILAGRRYSTVERLRHLKVTGGSRLAVALRTERQSRAIPSVPVQSAVNSADLIELGETAAVLSARITAWPQNTQNTQNNSETVLVVQSSSRLVTGERSFV